ncbi:MAG: DUF2284 domain-containing protein [Oscillospiraceae bacterium]|nr:DUF2284 domain-containing protein [Oscillospiraceae bacterium]
MDFEKLETGLGELPLEGYFFIDPRSLDFSDRVRQVCRTQCPRYGKTWACPPAVGEVAKCREKCRSFESCLMILTAAEVSDISNMAEDLATRPAHEAVTDRTAKLLRDLGAEPYVLSTESCGICGRCTYPEGKFCRHPEKMHPCVESHGINLIPTLEENGLEFRCGGNVVTWVSLLFF